MKLKFLSKKDILFEYCYLALENHFESEEDFSFWYESIEGEVKKDTFLKVASYYLALVKSGDWHVDIPDSNEVIDYFTNTFKYIALFSLIESLSNYKHIEFYDYLKRKKSKTVFPLSEEDLEMKYRTYKEEYGAIKRCISFFDNLSQNKKRELLSKLHSPDGDPSIEKFAKYLYGLRSEFVHQTKLIHEMAEAPVFSKNKKKIVVCYLSMADAMNFFEEGLLAWCDNKQT